MQAFNLPDGVTTDMIPGFRKEDADSEQDFEITMTDIRYILEECDIPNEYLLEVVTMGIEAFKEEYPNRRI